MKKITESVWNFLVDEGFRPTDNDGFIRFKFEMMTFLYIKNENDEQFFQLVLPSVHTVAEENKIEVLRVINKINSEYKVLKASMIDDNVSMFIEMFMDEKTKLGDVFMRALSIAVNARMEFSVLV